MSISKIKQYIFSLLLVAGSCAGMDKCPDIEFDDGNSGFCLSAAPNKMNSRQVMRYFRQEECSDRADRDILDYLTNNYPADKTKSIVQRFRAYPSAVSLPSIRPVTEQETRDQINKARMSMESWMDKFLPTGDNNAELERLYGAYEFDYGSGPCHSFYMSISLPEHKDFVYMLLDKNGWIVLFQYNRSEWHHGDMYYEVLQGLAFRQPEKYIAHQRMSYF